MTHWCLFIDWISFLDMGELMTEVGLGKSFHCSFRARYAQRLRLLAFFNNKETVQPDATLGADHYLGTLTKDALYRFHKSQFLICSSNGVTGSINSQHSAPIK